jgi:hypothetical protein
MICWCNALGLDAQSTSPFVHASKCQSEWSSKGLERKRSIPLACMRRSSLSEAMQSWERMRIMPRLCKRKREQGWVEPDGEMISIKVPWLGGTLIVRLLIHVEHASSLSLFHLPLFFISLAFFSLSLIFPFLFFLSFFHFLFFFFSSSFFSLFFWGKTEQHLSLVRMDPVARCSPITPTLGILCLMTPKIKCAMLVSPSECVPSQKRVPSVQLMQLPCFRASHDPRSFNHGLKWLVTENTRRCMLS